MEPEGGLSAVRESHVLGAYVRFAGLAEEDHLGLCASRHGPHQGVVGVEDRGAAVGLGGQRLDEFALGLCDLLASAELADVGGADVEDEADLRRASVPAR